MSKRVKIIVSVLVALLLTVGIAATVMAKEEPAPLPETEEHPLLTKVAGILEIEPGVLIAAFEQAREEIRQECQLRMEEADAIGEWQGNRPETLDQLPLRARISKAVCGRQMVALSRGWRCPPPELAD